LNTKATVAKEAGATLIAHSKWRHKLGHA